MCQHSQPWLDAKASLDKAIDYELSNASIRQIAELVSADKANVASYVNLIHIQADQLAKQLDPRELAILEQIIAFARAEGVCLALNLLDK